MATEQEGVKADDDRMTVDRFIFQWFNERYAEEMAICLREYDDRFGARATGEA